MNTTSTGAGRNLTAAQRGTGSPALRAAGRQLLATAGNQVLKAAVDRAVDQVDQTAGRLNAFAAREPRPSRARVAGASPARATGSGHERPPGGTVPAKIGASLSFVAQRAMLLLQLIQRLARQLLDALASLVRRARGSAPDEEGERTGRTSPRDVGNKPEAVPAAPGGGQAAPGRARPPQSPRRPRPSPGASEARVGRRVAGVHPGQAVSDE